jgi:hypothetical protein
VLELAVLFHVIIVQRTALICGPGVESGILMQLQAGAESASHVQPLQQFNVVVTRLLQRPLEQLWPLLAAWPAQPLLGCTEAAGPICWPHHPTLEQVAGTRGHSGTRTMTAVFQSSGWASFLWTQ